MGRPALQVIRGGIARTTGPLAGGSARGECARLPNGRQPRSLPALTDDPLARRRELAVVLELCAAGARGRRERWSPGVP